MIDKNRLTHLKQLEAESMHIMKEVVAEFENPAMLYSVGKDSSVMLHLFQKAFYPAPPPLPLVHVDTKWKFKEMIEFRDKRAKEVGMELIVYSNPKGDEMNISPFTHGSALHTDIMKTEGLKQMLDIYKFDAVFGGARRDEEKSRAKERIYSFRDKNHRWDPKNQRPELWNIYNGRHQKGESIRVFPLSNWTELDIWQYIYLEQIPIPDLYFAKEREIVEYMGTKIMVDDDRMPHTSFYFNTFIIGVFLYSIAVQIGGIATRISFYYLLLILPAVLKVYKLRQIYFLMILLSIILNIFSFNMYYRNETINTYVPYNIFFLIDKKNYEWK